jgi:hypothetical protein
MQMLRTPPTTTKQAVSRQSSGNLRAWGASRALDYLETVSEVDAKRVGIAGVSRYGKAALVTMAFDRRFAAGLIASSGAGGTALYRRNFGESLENLAGSGGYHWMAGNYLKYAAEEPSFGRSDDYMREKMPAVNVGLLDGALAWCQHDGGHTDGPNVEHFLRWAEAHWTGDKTGSVSQDSQPDRRSLKDAVGDRFKIGVARDSVASN